MPLPRQAISIVQQKRTGQPKCDACGEIAGILGPDSIAVVGEQPNAELQRGLRSAGDDDLRRFYSKAAEGGEMSGHLLATARALGIQRNTLVYRLQWSSNGD